jgi:hypothetical protein
VRRQPLLHHAQRLEAEWPVAAVDEEAGPVAGVDHVAAHRAAELARRLERRLARVLAAHDLDELHHGRRVEEVHADHPLRAGHACGDLGHAQRRRVGREHAVRAHDLGQAREQRALELERLRRRLDHDVGLRQPGHLGRRLQRPSRLQPPLLDLVLEPLGDPGQPALQRRGVGIVDERARARRRGELRDARAHRPGADDSDDHGYDGTSAFSPVSARPMMSFWICEVPS